MTNHFVYSFSFIMFLGFLSISSSDSNQEQKSVNNAFTTIDLGNKIHQDTTPSRSRSRSKETYRTNNDGQKVYLSIVDGEIKKFKVNGKKIQREDYKEYAELIEQIKSSNNTPTPPTPPTPPNTMEETENIHKEIEAAHLQIEKAHQEIEKAHKEIERAHQEIEKEHGAISDGFTEALVEDDLVEDEKNYKIYLSKKKFKVNGKTQNKTIHQKYLQLYEKLSGTKMNQNSVYQISHNDF